MCGWLCKKKKYLIETVWGQRCNVYQSTIKGKVLNMDTVSQKSIRWETHGSGWFKIKINSIFFALRVL